MAMELDIALAGPLDDDPQSFGKRPVNWHMRELAHVWLAHMPATGQFDHVRRLTSAEHCVEADGEGH